MPQSFSPEALLTLKRARTEAHRLGLQEVDADCLVIALTKDQETFIGKLFLPVEADLIDGKISPIQINSTTSEEPPELPFGREARRIFYMAFAEVNKWNHSDVQNIHILKAILHPLNEDNSGVLLLRACGANIDDLRRRTENYLKLGKQEEYFVGPAHTEDLRQPNDPTATETYQITPPNVTPLWRREPTQPAVGYNFYLPPEESNLPQPPQPFWREEASGLKFETGFPPFGAQQRSSSRQDAQESAMEYWFTPESSAALHLAKMLAEQSGSGCITRFHLLKALCRIKDAYLELIFMRMPALPGVSKYVEQSSRDEIESDVPPFSDGAIRVLRLARAQVPVFKDAHKIPPEIIFYSLLLDEPALLKQAFAVHEHLEREYALAGLNRKLLQPANSRSTNTDTVESRIRFSAQMFNWPWLTDTEVPITTRTANALRFAREEAIALKSHSVQTLHLVLGLLREGDALGLLPAEFKDRDFVSSIRSLIERNLQEDMSREELAVTAEQATEQTSSQKTTPEKTFGEEAPEETGSQVDGTEPEQAPHVESVQREQHQPAGVLTDYVGTILLTAESYAESVGAACVDLNHLASSVAWINRSRLSAISETTGVWAVITWCLSERRSPLEVESDFHSVVETRRISELFESSVSEEAPDETDKLREQARVRYESLYEHCSVRTKKLLHRAREEACQLNENRIAIQHLILALMYEIASPSSEALYAVGLTYEHARSIIADLKLHDFNRHSCNRGLTARAKELLQKAKNIMLAEHQRVIEPEHIMLAIISEHNRLAMLLFEALDIEPHQLKDMLEFMLDARLSAIA